MATPYTEDAEDWSEANLADPETYQVFQAERAEADLSDPETKVYYDSFSVPVTEEPAAPSPVRQAPVRPQPHKYGIPGETPPPEWAGPGPLAPDPADPANAVETLRQGSQTYQPDVKPGRVAGYINAAHDLIGPLLGQSPEEVAATKEAAQSSRNRFSLAWDAAGQFGLTGVIARKWHDWGDSHKADLEKMYPRTKLTEMGVPADQQDDWYEATMDKVLANQQRTMREGIAKKQAEDPTWAPDESFLEVLGNPGKWGPWLAGSFIGGADPTMALTPGGSAGARVAGQVLIGGTADAGAQGLDIKDEVADEFSFKQMLLSAAIAGGARAGFEIPGILSKTGRPGEGGVEGANPFARDEVRPPVSPEQTDTLRSILQDPESTWRDAVKFHKDNNLETGSPADWQQWYKDRADPTKRVSTEPRIVGQSQKPAKAARPEIQREMFSNTEQLGKKPPVEPDITVTAAPKAAPPKEAKVGAVQGEMFPRAEVKSVKPTETPMGTLKEGADRPVNQQARSERVNEAVRQVDEMTKGWKNRPAYEIVDDLSEVNPKTDPALRAAIDKTPKDFETMVGVTTKDGRVIINMKNVDNPSVLAAVTHHEGLGHHGMAQQWGDELDTILKDVYENSKGTFKKDVDDWLKENPSSYVKDPDRVARAAEEVLADMSNAGRITPTLYGRISKMIADFSRKMGRDVRYSPREIRTILGMAHDATVNGKRGDVAGNGFRYMQTGERGHQGLRRLRSLDETRDAYENMKSIAGKEQADKSFGTEGGSRVRTGWFRGNDDEWRFEIDDSSAKFNEEAFMRDAQHASIQKTAPKTLGDYLDHPELYKLYPNIKNTKVTAERDANYAASYYPTTGDIRLNPASSDLKGSLLHEVQHKVQHIEGFAGGGNTRTVIGRLSDKDVDKLYKEEVTTAKEKVEQETIRLEEINKLRTPESLAKIEKIKAAWDAENKAMEKLNRLRDEIPDMLVRVKDPKFTALDDERWAKNKEYQEIRDAVRKDLGDQYLTSAYMSENPKAYLDEVVGPYERLLGFAQDKLDRLTATDIKGKRAQLNSAGKGLEAYNRLEGEVEARDTTGRMDYGAEERKSISPGSTEPELTPDMRFIVPWDSAAPSASERFMMKKPSGDKKENIGSINPNKISTIHSPEEIDDILRELSVYNQKTNIPEEETWAAAEARGLSPSRVAKRRNLGNPGELASLLTAGNMALDKQLEKVLTIQKRLNEDGFNMKDYEAFMREASVLKAVHARISMDNSEMGRAFNMLRQFRQTNNRAQSLSDQLIETDAKIFTDEKSFMKFMTQLGDEAAAGNDAAATRMIKDAFRPGFEDVIFRTWYSMKLSSPKTHVANFAGTGINAILDIANDLGAAAIGQTRRFDKTADRVAFRQVGMRVLGMTRAIADATTYSRIRSALNTGRTTTDVETKALTALEKQWAKEGRDPTAIRRDDVREYMAKEGIDPTMGQASSQVAGTGHVYTGTNKAAGFASGALESPIRIMAGTDEWWRSVVQLGGYYSKAYSIATKEGLKGAEWRTRTEDLINNPTPDMLRTANDTAKSLQFLDTPSRFAKVLIDAQTPKAGDSPGLRAARMAGRFAVPFVRTPDRLLARAVHLLPTTVATSKFRAELKAGGATKDRAIARLIAGSALAGWVASKAVDGSITGQGPADPHKKKDWERSHQANSIRIGNQEYSIQGLEPISTDLSVIATMVERARAGEISTDNARQTAGATALTLAEAFLNNQYLEDFQQIVSITEERPKRRLRMFNDYIDNVMVGFTQPAVMTTMNQIRDPSVRAIGGDGTADARTVNKFKSGTSSSVELPQVYDNFGRPQIRDFYGPDVLSRVRIKDVRPDPVVDEVQRLTKNNSEVIVSDPGRTVGTEKRRLTDEEFENYKRFSGIKLRLQLSMQMLDDDGKIDPAWNEYTDDEKVGIIKKLRDKTRKQVREKLFKVKPEDDIEEDDIED